MISCIAIDDEPLALKQISAYINKTPFLELKGSFESAIETLDFLQDNKIDLMFADIQMPDLSGMEMVKSLENRPEVIFTTAFSQYAVEGFKVNAIDYLLKPIDYTSFLKSANKAQLYIKKFNESSEKIESNSDYLFIKSEYKIVRIEIKNILYIEAMREYIRIHLESKEPIMTLLSLKKIEAKLANSNLMRVHRSYIVNLEKITTIERNRIIFNKVYIPVSEQYKEGFQKYLDKNFLI